MNIFYSIQYIKLKKMNANGEMSFLNLEDLLSNLAVSLTSCLSFEGH